MHKDTHVFVESDPCITKTGTCTYSTPASCVETRSAVVWLRIRATHFYHLARFTLNVIASVVRRIQTQ